MSVQCACGKYQASTAFHDPKRGWVCGTCGGEPMRSRPICGEVSPIQLLICEDGALRTIWNDNPRGVSPIHTFKGRNVSKAAVAVSAYLEGRV